RWADNFSAGGCGETGEHRFQHPFLQAVGMFLGEFSCLGVFYLLLWRDRRRSEPRMAPPRPYNPLLFLPPALCDMTGTSIMYVALNMTSASSFQMLRGSVIVFTGLLSVGFLGRRLELSQWLGIGVTILGLLLVGLADLRGGRGQQHQLSQVITGRFAGWDPPLLGPRLTPLPPSPSPSSALIGFFTLIGFFGFVLLALLLIPMYYIPAGGFSSNPRGVLEDAPDAFCQVARRPIISAIISVALLGTVTSIAFFNFAGLSVTKELSATTRMVLDSLRTLAVWGFGLILGWESFHALQLVGFGVLLAGTA
ncbi:Transmembrane protein C2orf18-like protein, partial [Anas platyrhynchos]